MRPSHAHKADVEIGHGVMLPSIAIRNSVLIRSVVADESDPFSRRRPGRSLPEADSRRRAVFEIGNIDRMELRVWMLKRTHVEGQAMAIWGPTQAHRVIRRITNHGYFPGLE